MYLGPIRNLQIDLVSSCNARCPCCYRQNDDGHVSSVFPANRQLDLKLLEKALQDPILQLDEISFGGNYGDALACPQLIETLDLVEKNHPGVGYYLHTNAGLGSSQTWADLAQRVRGPKRFVTFSIDGLEDTNAIYRRGVSWSVVMKNAQTFINAGGVAVWKFIVFKHNEHQIEEARKMSRDMGFSDFVTAQNYSPESEPFSPPSTEKLSCSTISGPDISFYDVTQEQLNKVTVQCHSQERALVFIDFDGFVWPCCWIGGWKYSANSKRLWHQKNIETLTPQNFNSLKDYSLTEILSHPWFKTQISKSWKNASLGTHSECLLQCGKQCSN